MSIEQASPFEIRVDDGVLADLAVRLEATRLPPEQGPPGWDAGGSPVYLRELLEYWRHGFDWRAQEARLNAFTQLRVDVDEAEIHLIYERGRGPRPMPLLLTHGFPDSFTRFLKLIPLLTDPASHGADPADSFDVVVPSLPWCGFSRTHGDRGLF